MKRSADPRSVSPTGLEAARERLAAREELRLAELRSTGNALTEADLFRAYGYELDITYPFGLAETLRRRVAAALEADAAARPDNQDGSPAPDPDALPPISGRKLG